MDCFVTILMKSVNAFIGYGNRKCLSSPFIIKIDI